MADGKVDPDKYDEMAVKIVEVWASTIDAFLQEFITKGRANDRLGCTIACARISQAGRMMSEDFLAVAKSFIESETELKAAANAATQTITMIDGQLKAIKAGLSVSAARAATPDRSLS